MTNSSPFSPGNCAVITGGASGIGLAAAKRFAAMGLKVVIADLPGDRLDAAAREVAAASPNGAKGVRAAPTDVSDSPRSRRWRRRFGLRPGRRPDEQRRHRTGQLDLRRRLGAGGASST